MKPSFLISIIRWLVYGVIVGTPLFYLKESVYPYTLSKTAFFLILVELLIIAWAFLVVSDRRYRPRLTPASRGLVIFMAILTATALLGVDPVRSFWSMQDRMIGVFAFLHLAAFGFILSNSKEIIEEKRIFLISLGTASFVVLLAIIQLWNPSLLLNESIGGRPGATFGNPSFLAGYLVLHIIWLIYYFLRAQRQSFEWWYLLGSGMFLTLGLLITQTRGNLLGLAVGLVVLVGLFAWRPPSEKGFFSRRSVYAACLAVLVLGPFIFLLTRTHPVWDALPPGLERFRTISLSTPDLQPRIGALRVAWQGFLERPMTGWGWENFNVVFNKHYDPSTLQFGYLETRFDKPHNYLLELLVTGGLPLFLSYLGLLASLLLIVWRRSDRLWAQTVTAAIVAHVVGTAFIFETLGALLLFYLIFGLSSRRYLGDAVPVPANATVPPQKTKPARSDQKKSSGVFEIGAYVLAAVAAAAIFFVNIPTLRASYYQYHGFTSFRKSASLGISNFQKAISIGGPYQWNLERDYAAAISEAYFHNPATVSPEAVKEAIAGMERVASEHPLDAYNYYALVDMYNEISDIDPEGYTAKAEAAGARALELSPNRQQIIFSLAKTKSIQGDNKGALALVKKGLDLNPKVPDAHFYYGILSFAVGDNEQGYKSIKEALALGRAWKYFNEPLLVANFFAESGHLDEAITLYEKAKSMPSSDIEVKMKLGIAYYMAGRLDDARREISEVMKETDLAANSRYTEFLPMLRALGLAR